MELNSVELLEKCMGLIRWFGKELPAGDLSNAERLIMGFLLRKKSMLPSEISQEASLSSQLTSHYINNLEKLGYVRRLTSRDDKRKSNITLTKEGVKKVNLSRKNTEHWLNRRIDISLSGEEVSILKLAIPVLHKLIESK